ncbi:MAG: methyltransferase family protein [Planctomycetota bacterium]
MAENKLKASGIRYIVGTFLGPFILTALLFYAAGRTNIPRAWLCLAVSLTGMFGGIIVVAAHNPELVNHRGGWKKKKDTKLWDKFWVPIYGITAYYVPYFVIGLDLKDSAPNLGILFAVLGSALFIAGSILLHWAMLVNTHFEVTVRIQKDREHKVITAGPYKFVRHPGYVGAILWALSPPLIVGSAVALIPAAIAAGLLIVRTILEDRMLRRKLDGYDEYAATVKYKLFPWLW